MTLEKILKAYDTEETFFYLDPPYVLELVNVKHMNMKCLSKTMKI